LKEDWNKEEQERALQILIYYPDLRQDLKVRNLTVWALNYDLGYSDAIQEHDCHLDSCTIIGLKDVDQNESFLALVNIETKRLYSVSYSGGWMQSGTQ